VNRHARGRLGHLGRANRLAHVLAVKGHPAGLEADLEGAGDVPDREAIVNIGPGAQHRQRDRAVHRAGIQVGEAEAFGERPRDG